MTACLSEGFESFWKRRAGTACRQGSEGGRREGSAAGEGVTRDV